MYHQVGIPAPRGTPYRGLTVHPSDFRRQMVWLRRLGYRGLSMRDLMPHLRDGSNEKVVGITFDDGYRNVFRHAMPVLMELGFTATNYFVARQLDGSNVWDAEDGIPASPLMSAVEMRGWHEAGFEVGSHTLDHVHLPALSPELADYQIRQSKLELEQLLEAEVTAFCYPYGDESADVRGMARRAGYSNATTTERGLARQTDDAFGLPRVVVSRSTNIIRFLVKCTTRLEDRRRTNRAIA
ncbi:MAG TPA: polysaccharide deacetylase family protein [Burkholderiaceae bacterium]|nr:polysaccharide deacetylase family protein [Burkholderiaceae bacterium]